MVSNSVQVSNLRKLEALDKELWDAFQKIEKAEPIPFLSLCRFRRVYLKLKRNEKVDWRSNYLTSLVVGAISAVLFIISAYLKWNQFIPSAALVVYSICILWTFWARKNFIRKYSEFALKNTEFAEYAFGLHSISLLVKRIVDKVALPNGSDRKNALDALIKINKAAQDHGEVNFGFVEVLKKTAYAGILSIAPAISWMIANEAEIQKTSNIIHSQLAMPWLFFSLLFIVGLSIIFLIYDIVIGQSRLKKKKKRYLLVLNIIKETAA